MPDIQTQVRANRAALLRGDTIMLNALAEMYGSVIETIESEIAAQSGSDNFETIWWQEIRDRAADKLAEISSRAVSLVERRQNFNILKGLTDAEDILSQISPRLNVPLANRIALSVQQGSPLRQLFQDIAPRMAERLQKTFVANVAMGRNPRETAKALQETAQIAISQAQTIARTETLRAYRSAVQTFYEENATETGIQGWIWLADTKGIRSRIRTCGFCWAMHGSKHNVTEEMATHPNCRCSMAPWHDEIPIPNGVEEFAQIPVTQKLQILGPTKFDAYQRGELQLNQLVGFRQDPRWGLTGYEVSANRLGLKRPITAFPRTAEPPRQTLFDWIGKKPRLEGERFRLAPIADYSLEGYQGEINIQDPRIMLQLKSFPADTPAEVESRLRAEIGRWPKEVQEGIKHVNVVNNLSAGGVELDGRWFPVQRYLEIDGSLFTAERRERLDWVIHHEVAHAYATIITNSVTGPFDRLNYLALNEIFVEAGKISSYANQNNAEAWAEIMALYATTGRVPGPVSAALITELGLVEPIDTQLIPTLQAVRND